jgi:hypothetical protein
MNLHNKLIEVHNDDLHSLYRTLSSRSYNGNSMPKNWGDKKFIQLGNLM